jgi:hypothetical protein
MDRYGPDRYGTGPTLNPDGTFAPYDLAVSAGYARDVLPNLFAGVSVKLIYEKIDLESATGYAFDFGVMHRTMIEGLTLAASILNLGPQAKFVEEKFYPPLQLRVGGSYRYDEKWLGGTLILAGDVVSPNDSDLKIHLGTEYRYKQLLSVRFGYKSNYYVQGATLGAGVIYKNLRLDYAYMPMEYELGNSHRFSITVFSSEP